MGELVTALDFPDAKAALSMAAQLKGVVPWVKVGLELFTAEGPDMVRKLKDMRYNVFLDCKFYDIPNTCKGAAASAARLGADMMTVHLCGGERMCKAALDGARNVNEHVKIFGVTALTSFSEGEMPGIAMGVSEFAFYLAGKAFEWGLSGIVCSGFEVMPIKKAYPGLQCLCPGIRPAGSAAGDQRRIMTPFAAIKYGADYLVVGRPITKDGDPAEAAKRILNEMNGTGQ